MLVVGCGAALVFLMVLWAWAIIDCIATPASLIRRLPKLLWLVVIVPLGGIGGLLWLFFGRPVTNTWRPGGDMSAPPPSKRKQRARSLRLVRTRPSQFEEIRYRPITEVTDRKSQELDQRIAQWEREQQDSDTAGPDDI
ncbi:MAG: PLDc N-terminal domain-containing protein [Actinomycetota bacterium]|nr:PLDc N-terminal domain-containing protein [Actinomycetota bacterium]